MKKTDGLEILPKPRKKCLTPGTVAYFFAQFPAGRDEGLNYARLAAERSEHVRRFLEAYDGLPEHRRQLSIFDRLCREAEV